MNYIRQINSFYDALETNPLPAPAIALWHALHAIANKTGWQQEFSVPASILGLRSGLNEQAVKRARNKLKEAGYIEWRSRSGNRSAIYRLKEFAVQNQYQNVPQYDPQSEPQPVPQPDPQSEPINKQNENKTKEDPPKPPKGARIDYQGIVNLFHECCPSLPKVQGLTEGRKKAIKARCNDKATVEDFRDVFTKAEASDFLTGRSDKAWSGCGFDWLLRPSNWQKVREGNYKNDPDKGRAIKSNRALDYDQRKQGERGDLSSLVQY